jgi:dTDP-4-amino-4,6-dideoxygalactose transaminase
MTVPFVDLKGHHKLRSELRTIWEAVLDNAAFIGGRYLEQFESSFARFCEVEHAIGVGNGTDALLLALQAIEIGPNDEVITAANSFVATAEAIAHAGAKPVFVDIDPSSYTIDVEAIERHITPRTKAIIPVHLYGQPADMVSILGVARRHGLKIIGCRASARRSIPRPDDRLDGRRCLLQLLSSEN